MNDTSNSAPEYRAGHVQQALAEDDRTAEQGIDVTIEGEELYLRGDVTNENRRAALGEVAAEMSDGLHVHNDVRVVPLAGPGGEEEIR